MRFRLCGFALAGAALVGACSATGAVPVTSSPVATSQSAPATAPCARRILISGTGSDKTVDGFVTAFMCKYGVPNAQFAVSQNKTMIFSHAYTYQGKAISVTTTGTVMRLASNTKPWTGAALYTLVQANKVRLDQPVFAYLGLTTPLPANARVDPRVYQITIKDMFDHKSGWENDPSFTMRQTALALKLSVHIDQTQYVRFQLKHPLKWAPGTHYLYCNFCYDVLGMVVAKASGMSYIDYVSQAVSQPSGGGEIAISPTVNRLPDEVAQYASRLKGLSAYYPTLTTRVPAPYGGDGGVLEIAQGDGGAAASAETELAFASHYTLNFGFGTPPPPGERGWYEGAIEGTETWAEQMPNCTNYVFDINSSEFGYNTFSNYQAGIERYFKRVYRCS